MFFCVDCAIKGNWNWIGLVRSYGPCEMCKENALCENFPSEYMRKVRRTKKQKQELKKKNSSDGAQKR